MRKPALGKRLRNIVWPTIGLKRSLRYLGLRILRLDASAHSIAAGIASGVAVSFTPFLGLHFLSAFLLAFLTRGHLLAAAMGTFVGNPWTFPIFYAATGTVGSWITGEAGPSQVVTWSWSGLVDDPFGYMASLYSVLKPYILGAIPFIVGAWMLTYTLTKKLVERHRRRKKAALLGQRKADQAIKKKTKVQVAVDTSKPRPSIQGMKGSDTHAG